MTLSLKSLSSESKEDSSIDCDSRDYDSGGDDSSVVKKVHSPFSEMQVECVEPCNGDLCDRENFRKYSKDGDF